MGGPDARSVAADLARLRLELAQDREAMAAHEADARDVLGRWTQAPPDRPYLIVGAVAVHAWYTALETIQERVARVCDGGVPGGDTWHRDLLLRSMSEVPGVRPALLPLSLQADLLALLGFRHFFRNAYAVQVDAVRLRAHLERLVGLSQPVAAAIGLFDAFLVGATERLAARLDG